MRRFFLRFNVSNPKAAAISERVIQGFKQNAEVQLVAVGPAEEI